MASPLFEELYDYWENIDVEPLEKKRRGKKQAIPHHCHLRIPWISYYI